MSIQQQVIGLAQPPGVLGRTRQAFHAMPSAGNLSNRSDGESPLAVKDRMSSHGALVGPAEGYKHAARLAKAAACVAAPRSSYRSEWITRSPLRVTSLGWFGC